MTMTLRRSTFALLLLAFVWVGCDSGGSTVEEEVILDDIAVDAILQNEANNVILATYVDLETEATGLDQAVSTFVQDQTDANLQAAQDAWIATRAPWERSESFLFGPVAQDDLDPALDSWPVDENSIEAILAGSEPITVERVRNLSTNSKGFHTVEFLLFGPNGTKAPADFTAREIDYLTAATTVLAEDTQALANAWRPSEGGFASDFAAAATPDGQSRKAALETLAEFIEVIADEVGTGKIGTPLEEGTIARIESKYSENSFTDFTNNMESIRHIYTGDYKGNTGPGVDEAVRAVNPDLDTQLTSEIDAAISQLQGIELSFRKSVEQNQLAEVQAAQDAVLTIRETIQSQIRPLLSDL